MDFFERVKILVKKNTSFTLRSFIESLGINYETYYSGRRLNNLPRADDTVKIAQALNTTVEWLVFGDDTSALTPDESALLANYRILDETDKATVRAMLNQMIERYKKKHIYEINDTDDLYVHDSELSLEGLELVPGDLVMIPVYGSTAAGSPIETSDNIEFYIPFPRTLLKDKPTSYFWLTIKGYSMVDANIYDGDTVLLHKKDYPVDGRIMLVLYQNKSTLKRICIDKNTVYLCWEDGSGKRVRVSSADFIVQAELIYIAHKPGNNGNGRG